MCRDKIQTLVDNDRDVVSRKLLVLELITTLLERR